MTYAIAEVITYIDPGALLDNPVNAEYHATFDPDGRDAWLVADVAEHGVMLPLLLMPDGRTIYDGHRRRAAAVHCGHVSVPCAILTSETEAAFRSAQLARELTIYAKCLLYRETINDLIARGLKNKAVAGTEDAARAAAVESLDEDWFVVEDVLQVTRRRLREGVQMLDRLDAMRSSGGKDADLAAKVTRAFRERGLGPAQRLLGETETDDTDDAPDCKSWAAADTSPIVRSTPKGRKPTKKRAAKHGDIRAEPARPRSDEWGTLWRDDSLYLLSEIRAVLEDAGELTAPREAAIEAMKEVL